MERLGSVHLGHTLIHEDKIIGILPCHIDGIGAVRGSIYLHLGILQQIDNDGQIDPRIIHDKYSGLGCMERLLV